MRPPQPAELTTFDINQTVITMDRLADLSSAGDVLAELDARESRLGLHPAKGRDNLAACEEGENEIILGREVPAQGHLGARVSLSCVVG